MEFKFKRIRYFESLVNKKDIQDPSLIRKKFKIIRLFYKFLFKKGDIQNSNDYEGVPKWFLVIKIIYE